MHSGYCVVTKLEIENKHGFGWKGEVWGCYTHLGQRLKLCSSFPFTGKALGSGTAGLFGLHDLQRPNNWLKGSKGCESEAVKLPQPGRGVHGSTRAT